jgi:peptide/nickel transport system permease protein
VTSYLVRRIVWAVVLVLAMTLVVFILFFVVPANPADQATAGLDANSAQRIRHLLGFDRPVWEQYALFVKRLFVDHSLGVSNGRGERVGLVLSHAWPVTASLVLGAAVLWTIVAIPLGVLSGMRPRSRSDRAASVFVLLGISTHPIIIGLVLSYVVGYRLGWTPVTGYCSFRYQATYGCGGPAQWFSHLILPWITFSLFYIAIYTRMIRASVIEARGESHVLMAEAKGAGTLRVIRVHILRNAALPIVTMLGMDIGFALGNAFFTEEVFSLPGVGSLFVSSVRRGDINTTAGIVVVLCIVIIALNLIVDLFYTVLDPRIRVMQPKIE